MAGQVSHELVVNVPASDAWGLYSTMEFPKLVEKELPHLIHKIDLVEGDGASIGTVLQLIFPPGTPGFTSYKEKFTKVDHENRVKEAEVIEGGYLDLGFTLYRVRFEIMENNEKGFDSCVIKSTIEYELKEEAAANASIVSIEALTHIANIAKNYLLKNKNEDEN